MPELLELHVITRPLSAVPDASNTWATRRVVSLNCTEALVGASVMDATGRA